MFYSSDNQTFHPTVQIGTISVIRGTMKIVFPITIGLLYGSRVLGQYSVLYHAILMAVLPIELGLSIAILRFSGEMEKTEIYSTSLFITIIYLLMTIPIITLFLPLPKLGFLIGFIFLSFHLINHYFLWGIKEFQLTMKFEIASLVLSFFSLIFLTEIKDGFQIVLVPIIYSLSYFVFSSVYLHKLLSLSAISISNFKKIIRFSIFLFVANGLGFGIVYLQYPISEHFFGLSTAGRLTFLNLLFSPLQMLAYPFVVYYLSKTDDPDHSLNKATFRIDLILILMAMTFSLLFPLFMNIFPGYAGNYHPKTFGLLLFAHLVLASNSLKSIPFMKDEGILSIVPISSILGFASASVVWLFLLVIANPNLIPFGFLVSTIVINFIFSISKLNPFSFRNSVHSLLPFVVLALSLTLL